MSYKRTLNPVADFFDNTFNISFNAKIKKSEIYNYYLEYCICNGLAMLTKTRFWDCLKSYFDDKNISHTIKRIHGYDYISGIAVKEEFKNLEVN